MSWWGIVALWLAANLSDFHLARVIDLQSDTHHVQGIDFEGDRAWISSVDRPSHKGFLQIFSLSTGVLLRETTVDQGERFHPGGLSLDGESLWIPVAEYRAASSSVIQRRRKDTLELEFQFEVPDHIGCVAVTRDVLIGGNWDSKEFYVWDRQGKLIRKIPSTTGNAYQDIKFESGRVVASGLLADRSGAIDWLEYPSMRLVRRVKAGVNDRGVVYTREGMAIHGKELLLLPEDQHSRVFAFRMN